MSFFYHPISDEKFTKIPCILHRKNIEGRIQHFDHIISRSTGTPYLGSPAHYISDHRHTISRSTGRPYLGSPAQNISEHRHTISRITGTKYLGAPAHHISDHRHKISRCTGTLHLGAPAHHISEHRQDFTPIMTSLTRNTIYTYNALRNALIILP